MSKEKFFRPYQAAWDRYAMPGKPGGNVGKVLAWQAVADAK